VYVVYVVVYVVYVVYVIYVEIVSPRGESETATEHCRYIVPTARKIYRTFNKMKTTYGNDAYTANAKINSWRTVRRNRQSKGYMMSPMTTEQTEGGGN
jgi:hypothetical protein